ncbi:DNA polymerase III subunit epsilon [Corynebacterium maris DSM 45190]|uniref:DNA polymerase III subunit epsilon n=1 Tax=Corynebacterium maris DSM 45190 TaxID=1224163 RepID=S5SUD0_9CORY|nr:3'-5' exonuclease [Corynebacterium maris]AGS34647.1 DNA polymerase III subunit epsilon [Corynebacterium maris DSM 45190]
MTSPAAPTFDASRMLSFDLETTSANPMEARIVTSALVTIDGSSSDPYEMLADPGVEIPEEAAKIHGITTEKARAEGRPHDDVLAETVRRIKEGWEKGLTLVVYNASYDLTILRQLTGDFTVTGPVFDPYVIDKAKDRYRKGKRTLTDVSAFYGVSLDNAHEATADALAAARVAWKQVNKAFPELKTMNTDELMEFQAVSYYEMQVDLKKYLDSRGRDTSDLNTSWPMQG